MNFSKHRYNLDVSFQIQTSLLVLTQLDDLGCLRQWQIKRVGELNEFDAILAVIHYILAGNFKDEDESKLQLNISQAEKLCHLHLPQIALAGHQNSINSHPSKLVNSLQLVARNWGLRHHLCA